MSEPYKGLTVPTYGDAADGPLAFRAMVDSGPIPRFANAAARSTAIPAPIKGLVTYREDAVAGGALEFYDGTSWKGLLPTSVPTHKHPGTDITSDISANYVPNLPADRITSGTFAAARLPAGTASVAGALRLGDASNEAAPGNHTHPTASHTHDDRYFTEGQADGRYLRLNPGSTQTISSGGLIMPNGGLVVGGQSTFNSRVLAPGAPTTTNASHPSWKVGSGSEFVEQVSSRRFKAEIGDAPEEYVERLLGLHPVTFKSRLPFDDGDQRYLGLIAEEVHQVIPEITRGHNPETGDVDSVSYEALIVPLLMAVQHLNARLDALSSQ